MADHTHEQDPNAQADAWQQIKFTGSGLEFFKIWIVNLLLTLVTLGIYSAWATVRTRRYFYGNTHVAGSRFDFHGTGLQILVGRVIALVLLLGWSQGHFIHPYLPIVCIAIVIGLFPWFMVRALRFRMRNTSLHNLRFDFLGTSLYAYKLLGGYWAVLLALSIGSVLFFSDFINNPGEQPEVADFTGFFLFMFLSMVIYVLIYPAFVCDSRKFYINHAAFGDHRFSAQLARRGFIGAFFRALLMFVFFMVIAAVVGGVIAFRSQIHPFFDAGTPSTVTVFVGVIVVYGLFGLTSIVPAAYWQVFVFNATFCYLQLGENVKFKAMLATKPFAWLLISNLLMVLFSLGLAYPWAAIRLAKYKLEAIRCQGGFDSFEGASTADRNALGEEVGSAFDVEFGF